MSSEEQQLKDTTVEASPNPISDKMDIDVALLIYKNLTPALNDGFKLLISPYHHDKNGKSTKAKNQATKMKDLMMAAQLIEKIILDIEVKADQFESEKANNLYGHFMAVMKAKEVIKSDLRERIAAGSVENMSEELKQKVLKEL